MKQFHNLFIYTFTLLLLAATAACTDEEQGGMSLPLAEEEITFWGMVENEKGINTRSNDDFIFINSEAGKYTEMDYYIYQKINKETPTIQIYKASGGDQGTLVTKNENSEALKWHSTDAEHIFYAWTQPKKDETTEYTKGAKMNSSTEGTYSTTGTVTFGTQEETGLEHFIVTKRGPLTYDKTNQYVGLHFYHPIGKIVVDSIRHFRSDGSSEPITECTITFPNLYAKANFNAIAEMGENETPYEKVLTTTENPQKGMTWKWEDGNSDTYLYVLPFTFQDEKLPYYEQPGYFIVEAKDITYTGTLVGSSDQIKLNGNEVMHISMQLTDGNVTGIYSYIVNWTDAGETSIPQHRIPGIYTQEDAEALLNALTNNTEIPEYFFFGTKEGEEDKTIRFFTHVDWSEATKDIIIPENYTLDGQGYNLTLPEGITLYGTGTKENIIHLYVNNEVYIFQSALEPAPTPGEEGEGNEETEEGGKDEKGNTGN